MVKFEIQVKNYVVQVGTRLSWAPAEGKYTNVMITLYGSLPDDSPHARSLGTSTILFPTSDSSPMENYAAQEPSVNGTIVLPIEMYPIVMDLIRNERYLKLFLDTDNPQKNTIYSSGAACWGHYEQ